MLQSVQMYKYVLLFANFTGTSCSQCGAVTCISHYISIAKHIIAHTSANRR